MRAPKAFFGRFKKLFREASCIHGALDPNSVEPQSTEPFFELSSEPWRTSPQQSHPISNATPNRPLFQSASAAILTQESAAPVPRECACVTLKRTTGARISTGPKMPTAGEKDRLR
jgi:hypothetical protein